MAERRWRWLAKHRPRQANTQNAFIESFNGRLCYELLNEEVFDNLAHMRQALSQWRHDYNNLRPHSALDGFTPAVSAGRLSSWMAPMPGALAKPQPIKYSVT